MRTVHNLKCVFYEKLFSHVSPILPYHVTYIISEYRNQRVKNTSPLGPTRIVDQSAAITEFIEVYEV